VHVGAAVAAADYNRSAHELPDRDEAAVVLSASAVVAAWRERAAAGEADSYHGGRQRRSGYGSGEKRTSRAAAWFGPGRQ
jgi:hypothetical protein